jgi:hypothetical protein
MRSAEMDAAFVALIFLKGRHYLNEVDKEQWIIKGTSAG